MKAIVTGKET